MARHCTIRGMGATDPNCAVGMPYDVNGDPCPDPNAAVIVSSNPNPYYLPGLTPGPVYPSGVVSTGSPVTSGVFSPAVTQYPQSAQLPPGPSPRIAVPLSFSSVGMWASNNLPLLVGGVVLVAVLGSLGGRRRR